MVHERLKRLRVKEGWSVAETAEKLGLSKGTYAGYEYGRRQVPNDLLPKIADLYGVSTDYLLGRNQMTQDSSDDSEDDDLTLEEAARLKALLADPELSVAFRKGALAKNSNRRKLLAALELLADDDEWEK